MGTENQPPTVLHVIYRLDRDRGSTSWIATATMGEMDPPFRHVVLAKDAQPGTREPEFAHAGIPVHHCKMNPLRPLAYVRAVQHIMRSERVSILHTHVGWLAPLDLIAAWLCGVRVRIVYFHSGAWLFRMHPVRLAAANGARSICKVFATHFWAPSEGVLAAWIPKIPERRKDRYRAVHGGVPIRGPAQVDRRRGRAELGIGPVDFVVGHVGRFTEQKNHATLIRAFAQVLTTIPNSWLLLIGDGPLRPDMEALAARKNIATRVLFAGVRDNVRHWLALMDVFAFPSIYEPLGLAAVEAQDEGLPIVSSDIAGLREAVAPRWNAYRVDPWNPRAIAQALTATRQEQRSRPEEFVEYYSEARARNRLAHNYAEALGGKTR